MRQKIRELRNKEEGFTLVELLAVIVILGIIVAIAIPAIGNIIDSADGQATEAENQLILDAARLYDVDPETAEWSNPTTIQALIDAGFLDERGDDISNPDRNIYKHANGSFSFDAP